MKIGDKVKVVNSHAVYSTYCEMAKVMGLKKFHDALEFTSAGLMCGDVLTILDIHKHFDSYDTLIGGYCEHLDEDFIINIEGVETVRPKPLSKENAYYLCYTGGKQ